MRNTRASIVVIALLASTIAGAEPTLRSRYRYRVSPNVHFWLANPQLRPTLHSDGSAADQDDAPVSVRFRRDALPDAARLAQLAAGGVRWVKRTAGSDDVRHLGRFYIARVGPRGARTLARAADVEQVDLDAPLHPALPLATLGKQVGALATWAAGSAGGSALAGKGLTAGLIDVGIDVHHPAFFFADGKLYSWIDRDGDGRLGPGDAVDLDGDGSAGSGETLRVLQGRISQLGLHGQALLDSTRGDYVPRRDWLYVDANNNGKRDDAAPSKADATPTMGELLLVGEDLDGDGRVGANEKLRALGTSKIRAVLYMKNNYRRDANLSAVPNPYSGFHGTGTAGIFVGGQRGYQRHVGIAPDAQLAVTATGAFSNALVWLLKDVGADVVLHEYAPWTGYHLDGSSNHEQLIDQASQLGVPQITAAGNLGVSGDKHMRVQVPAHGSVQVPVVMPHQPLGPYYVLWQSYRWRDPGVDLSFELEGPNGHKHAVKALDIAGTAWGDTAMKVYSQRVDSSRGTAMVDVRVYHGSLKAPGQVTAGRWVMRVSNPSDKPIELDGLVTDYISSWNQGARFVANTTMDGTVCWPATADSAITVTAYAGQVGAPFDGADSSAGALRAYASRGKRIDGVSVLDIAAPDDPVTPVVRREGVLGLGEFTIFSGTSGAAPFVAGAALLLKQHDATLGADGIKTALRAGALVDADVTSGNADSWGAGKLRIYRAIHGEPAAANQPPEVELVVADAVYAGEPLEITARARDAEDKAAALSYRWDDHYDGREEPGETASTLTIEPAVAGTRWVAVTVRDSAGLSARAALRIEVLPPRPAASDAGPASDGSDAPADSTGGCAVASSTSPRALALWCVLLLFGLRLQRRRSR